MKELSAPSSQIGRFVWQVRDAILCTTPQAVGKYLRDKLFVPFDQFEQEELWLLLLNSRYRLTHLVMVYRGTVDGLNAYPRDLFRAAIRLNAHSLILAHNHPSGAATPSEADFEMTRRVIEAGELLGIWVQDHLVVGKDNWVSINEQGL